MRYGVGAGERTMNKLIITLLGMAAFAAFATIAVLLRYDITAAGDLTVYRLDRWTGAVVTCGISETEALRAREARGRGQPVPGIKFDC
jgi:hypothetical protein